MLTIILPVFNAQKYLELCLKSIIKQTYTDFEVILINDGSKDNSAAICKTFAKQDKRFIYINQANQGVAMARNHGLKLAKGTYIGFVDADDIIEPNMFQNIVNTLSENNYDVVLAHYKICNTDTFHIPKTKIPTKINLCENEIKNNILKTYYTGSDPIVPALWNKIYKRSFLEQHHLKFHNQKAVRASDYWFNFEVFQHASSAFVIEHANYCYNNAITGSIINSFRENQFEGFLDAQKKLLDANENFKFKVDNATFYTPFYNNTNQFILSALSAKGYVKAYPLIKSILVNEKFKSSFQYILNKKRHLKLIHFFMKNNLIVFSYVLYCIWHVTTSTTKKNQIIMKAFVLFHF